MIYELKSEFSIPDNVLYLVEIEQKIKNRDEEIDLIKYEISILKH